MAITRRSFLATAAAGAAAAGMSGAARAQGAPYALKAGKPFAGQTVNIMLPNAGQYRAQALRLAKLEELTGIKAVHSYVPYGQLLDKITTEAVSGSDTYDLVTYQDTWGPSLSPYLDPLDARVAADGVDLKSYPDVFVEASSYKKVLYGLPVRAQAQLLFYRKDLMEQAGVTPPKTMEELATVAKAIQDKTGVAGIAMDYGKGNGFQNLFSWMNYMRGHKADLLDAGGKVAFNSNAGIQATKMYLDLLLSNKVANTGSVQFIEGDKVNSVAQGNSAMVMVWWWAYPVLTGERSKLKPEQVGFVNVPTFGNDTKSNIGQCMPFAINKLSKKKDAAFEVLKWMANPDLESEIASDKSDPALNEIIVVHKASLQSAKVNEKNFGLQKVGYDSLVQSRPMPLLKTWPQVAAVLEASINEIAATRADVKTTLDAAASQVERIVRRSPE